MGHLNELHDKYAGKGFTVLAVTNETRDKVDAFVADLAPTHPIVIEGGDSLAAFGGGGFPSSFLIAPDGTLAWAGHPASVPEDLIEELLTKAKLFPELPRAFWPIRKSMEKGKLFDAQKALTKKIAGRDLPDEDKAWADKLQGWLDWNKDSAGKRAAKAAEKGDFYLAWTSYEALAKSWKGADFAKDAADQAKALLADKEKKPEIDAGKKLAKICRRLGRLSPKKAIKQLTPMTSSKYRDTTAGKQAASMIEGYQREIDKVK